MDKVQEKPDTKHGRLLEAVHLSGYTFNRACKDLEWLLEKDRWKTVGPGFKDIDSFLKTIDFSGFKIAIEQRKKLAQRLADLRATQRVTGKMLGVDHATINKDLKDGENSPKLKSGGAIIEEKTKVDGENSPKPKSEPSPIEEKTDGNGENSLKDNDQFRTSFTGENEWYTPGVYIAAAKEVMGHISLDPASSDIAQERIAAMSYFTKENDGLEQEWFGNIWMNPPYSQPLICSFIKKLVDEYESKRVEEAIILTHNYTDTSWFHLAESKAALICFTRGRIRFEDKDGNLASPTQGSVFFYFGNNLDKFREVFSQFGFIR